MKGKEIISVKISEPEEYEVERILDKKKIDGEWKYLIKWSGFGIEHSTWEPRENLTCDIILEQFEKEWNIFMSQRIEEEKKTERTTRHRKLLCENFKESSSDDQLSEYESRYECNKNVNVNINNLNSNGNGKRGRGRPRLPDHMKKSFVQQNIPLIEKENTLNIMEIENVNFNNNLNDPADDSIEEKKENEDDQEIDENPNFFVDREPVRVIKVILSGNIVNCLVEWDFKNDGVKPDPSFVPNYELRKKFPDLLLDYYEKTMIIKDPRF